MHLKIIKIVIYILTVLTIIFTGLINAYGINNPYLDNIDNKTKIQLDTLVNNIYNKKNQLSTEKFNNFSTDILKKLLVLKNRYSSNKDIVNIINYISYEINEAVKTEDIISEKYLESILCGSSRCEGININSSNNSNSNLNSSNNTDNFGSCNESKALFYKSGSSCTWASFECKNGKYYFGKQFLNNPEVPAKGAKLYNTFNLCDIETIVNNSQNKCEFNMKPYLDLGLKTTFYFSDKKYEPDSNGVMTLPGDMKNDFYAYKGDPTNPQVYFKCNDGTLTISNEKYQLTNPLYGVTITGNKTKINSTGTGNTTTTNSDGITSTTNYNGITTLTTYAWSCIVPNNDVTINPKGFTCDEKNIFSKKQIEGYSCNCYTRNVDYDNTKNNIKNNVIHIVEPTLSFLGFDKKNNKMKFSVKNYNKYSGLMLHQNTIGKMVLQCYSLGISSCMKAEKISGDYNESIFEIKLTDFAIDNGFKKDNVIAIIPSIYDISTDSNTVNLAGYYSNNPIKDSDFSYIRSYDSNGQWLEWKTSSNVKNLARKSVGPNGIRFNDSGSLNLSKEFLSFDVLKKHGWLPGAYDMTWNITLNDGTSKTYKEYFSIPK